MKKVLRFIRIRTIEINMKKHVNNVKKQLILLVYYVIVVDITLELIF
jgi:hypothetical protein